MAEAFIYVISEEASPYLKIGVTTDIERRLSGLQTGNPRKLFVADLVEFECERHAYFVESAVHSRLAGRKKQGEWFDVPVEQVTEAINRAFSELVDRRAGRGPSISDQSVTLS